MRRKGCARFWLNFSIFILCRVKNLRGDELTINPVLIGSLLYVMWRLLLYFVFRFPHHWGGLLFLLLLLCLLLLLLLLLLLVSTYSIQIIGQSVVIGAAEPVPRADWRKIWKVGGRISTFVLASSQKIYVFDRVVNFSVEWETYCNLVPF